MFRTAGCLELMGQFVDQIFESSYFVLGQCGVALNRERLGQSRECSGSITFENNECSNNRRP